MVNRDDLLHWLHTLDRNSQIGIDAGGLCLREVTPDDTLGEAYYEIGGIPEEIEHAQTIDDYLNPTAIPALVFEPEDSVDRAEKALHVE